MTTISSATQPPLPLVARPDLLAYPAPSTSRFVLLLVALLGSGLFVGDWLHSQVAGSAYVDAYRNCQTLAQEQVPGPDGLEQMTARPPALDACRMSIERDRAAFVLGGGVAVGVGGLVVLYVAPHVIARRRRLRPLGTGLEPARRRFAELAVEAGLARCPILVLGASAQRDAFSFGAPGRYVVVLPPALAVRWHDQTLFEPVMRHELAHIRHRDVAFAWLARSVWYVFAPALVLPLIYGVISGDNSLAPAYLWRAALLGITVQLVAATLLRSREHDADLRAARLSGGYEPVARVVMLARPRAVSWYRRPLSSHPDPDERLAVLKQPDSAAAVSFLDGFAAAFLAALTAPLGVSLVIAGTVGSAPPSIAPLVIALIAGLLLGGSVGLALWRASAVARVTGRRVSPWRAALGVAAGLLVGRVSSLDVTGSGLLGVSHPAWFILVALAGVGVTVLVFSVGEVWADAAPSFPRAWPSWAASLLVTGLTFAVLIWVSLELDIILALDGWASLRTWLLAMPDRWLAVATVGALVVCVTFALVARRHSALTPRWILEEGEPAPWPVDSPRIATIAGTGILAGFVGAVTIVGFFLLAGPSNSNAQILDRFFAYIWLAGAVGGITSLVLAALRPRVGLGLGVLAGSLASMTAIAGFHALNFAYGAEVNAKFIADSVFPSIVIGFFLAVILAPVTSITPAWGRSVPRLWVVATPAALAAALAVIGATGVAVSSPAEEAQHYVRVFASDTAHRYRAVEKVVDAIDADQLADDSTRALRIRSEAIPPSRALLHEAQSYQPSSPEIERVHASAVAALRARLTSLELFALAFESGGDAKLSAQAGAKRDEGIQALQQWLSSVTELAAG